MRFGCCLNMLSTQPDGTGAEYLNMLKAAGYAYVELPLAEMCAMPESDLLRLREKLASLDLSCETCNNFFPKTFRLTGRTQAAAARRLFRWPLWGGSKLPP